MPTIPHLRIWQQNLNTSHTAQLSLLNSPISNDWDILAIQEPALNSVNNTRASAHWRVVYPTRKYTHGDKPRIDFPSADVVVIQFSMSNGLCTVFNIYNDNNHDNTVEAMERFMDANKPELRPAEGDHMLWLGDFNRHHPLWDEERNNHLFTAAALEASGRLLDLVADHGMVQALPTLQSSSTRNWTRPDNVFCTEHTSDTIASCNTAPDKRGPKTDHVPILTTLDMSIQASPDSPSWNYRSVDWDKFNSALNDALTNQVGPPRVLETAEEFQQAARNLDLALCQTVESSVPKTHPHPHTKRWWTQDLSKLSDELKHLRRQAYKLRALPNHDIHANLREKENSFSKEIQKTKETHWKDWLNGMVGTDIWIAHKYLSNPGGDGGKTHIPTLRKTGPDGQDVQATTNEEKSEILAQALFPPPPAVSTVPTDHLYPEPAEKWTDITREQLTQTINNLSPYKAPGPDGVANIVFQHCRVLTDYLLPLFNAVINLRTYYDPWRESITVILRKPGKPDYSIPKAYRPIALLNTTVKILSAIVADRTSFILETHNLLPGTHFGGRPGRSTEDSLHLLENTIRHAWRQKKVVSALFLDIEGVFPNAVTDRLLHNMKARCLPPEIVTFTERMLRGRKMKLRFNDYTSEWFDITNGIGQGDPLSMILYIIYDSDLVEMAKGKRELTLAFVDDTAFLAIGETFQETHRILRDMLERRRGGFEWSSKHNSRFEPSKFALMDFSLNRSRERPPMTIRGAVITPSPTHKFLGVILDQELRWREHTAYAIAKGAHYAMLIRRISRSAQGVPAKLVRQLYRAVVVPRILYAASVWLRPTYNEATNKTIHGSVGVTKKIAQTQRTAALAITGAMRSSPGDSLEIHADLYPVPLLVQRTLYNALIRMSTLPTHHPLNPIITRIATRGTVKRHKTAIHNLAQHLATDPRTIETIYPRPIHPDSHTPFNTSIAASKEDAIAEFRRCTTRTMIFTDGSSTNGKVGAAASLYVDFTHIATLRYHLGDDTEHTVFEAEAVGLILAAQLLLTRNEATFPVTIFADNQAVIRSGARPTAKPGHYLLFRFRNLVRHLQERKDLDDTSISLNWIAGHADIEGNELADREVKLAATRRDMASPCRDLPKTLWKRLPRSTSAVKQAHEAHLQAKWSDEWKTSTRYAHIKALDPSHTSKSFLRLTSCLRKTNTAVYIQLRTGHAPLNKHLHRIKKSATPHCLQCEDNQIETVHHYLFDCTRYDRERHILGQKLGHNALSTYHLLSNKSAQQALFGYIDSTKRLHATFGDIPIPPKPKLKTRPGLNHT